MDVLVIMAPSPQQSCCEEIAHIQAFVGSPGQVLVCWWFSASSLEFVGLCQALAGGNVLSAAFFLDELVLRHLAISLIKIVLVCCRNPHLLRHLLRSLSCRSGSNRRV